MFFHVFKAPVFFVWAPNGVAKKSSKVFQNEAHIPLVFDVHSTFHKASRLSLEGHYSQALKDNE